MKIERLFAVVESTPDDTTCEFLTTDQEEADNHMRHSDYKNIYEIDLNNLVEFLINNKLARQA